MTSTTPSHDTPPPPPSGEGPLLSQRTTLVLLVAVIAGMALGVLTYGHTSNVFAALIATAVTFGAALLGAHKLIS
ncbi:hypothetical protein [Lentzea sp. NPDC055074]